MSLQACADLVARGDPDRFRAAMATPPEARAVLFPLYAFNLEVSRAPWVTEEPMIAEMRLQFWRDVAEEIGQGARPRAHEVCAPLAAVVRAEDGALLDGLVAARRWDIYKDAFEDAGISSAISTRRAAISTGWRRVPSVRRTGRRAAVRDAAWAAALARFLRRRAGTGGAGAHPAGRWAGGGGCRPGGGGAERRLARARKARAPFRARRAGALCRLAGGGDPAPGRGRSGAVAEGRLAMGAVAASWRLARMALGRAVVGAEKPAFPGRICRQIRVAQVRASSLGLSASQISAAPASARNGTIAILTAFQPETTSAPELIRKPEASEATVTQPKTKKSFIPCNAAPFLGRMGLRQKRRGADEAEVPADAQKTSAPKNW
jgi:phytoene synthase